MKWRRKTWLIQLLISDAGKVCLRNRWVLSELPGWKRDKGDYRGPSKCNQIYTILGRRFGPRRRKTAGGKLSGNCPVKCRFLLVATKLNLKGNTTAGGPILFLLLHRVPGLYLVIWYLVLATHYIPFDAMHVYLTLVDRAVIGVREWLIESTVETIKKATLKVHFPCFLNVWALLCRHRKFRRNSTRLIRN